MLSIILSWSRGKTPQFAPKGVTNTIGEIYERSENE
jgi:hypothetical protein